MIKECITYLIEQDYNVQGLNMALRNISTYDEDQINFSLQNGISLMDDIVLYKYEGSGFRCINHMEHIYGRKPICNVIEKKLNEKLQMLHS